MAAQPSKDRTRRGGLPLALFGAVVLIALLAAYLSDCIPGLGSGGDVGTPADAPATAPAEAQDPAEPAAADARIAIIVQGDQCRLGRAAAAPCPEVCASLDRTHAATVEVSIEATEGRQGTVEDLRTCLQQAGFADVRVHAQ